MVVAQQRAHMSHCHIQRFSHDNRLDVCSCLGIIPAVISSTYSNWKLYQNYMKNLARKHTHSVAQLRTINTKEISNVTSYADACKVALVFGWSG